MVNVTRYDDRGLVAGATQVPAYNSAAAGSGPLNPDQGVVPSWTAHAYDAAQREREATLWAAGTKKWSTLTAPAADTTIVTPPSGGKDATTIDAFGNTTAITEDHGTPDAATTRYSYTVRNEQSKITDADGNVTQSTYNWAGERLSNDDPDAGRSTNTYDRAGNLASSVDAKNQKISYTYDALNRRTGQWSGEANTGTRLAEWAFDPKGALGQPSAAIRYINGQQYRTDVLGYDARYRPTGKRTTIPATEGALAGNYDTTYTYDKADHVTDITYPAAGGLPAEKVSAKYSPNTGVPLEMTSDLSGDYTYVKHNYYWSTGELAQRNYGKNGGIARAYTYEDPTGRLSRIKTITGNDTATKTDLQNDTYTYDPTGNVTDITDQLIQTGVDDTPQHQCFTYDGADRLKEAWTTTASNCAAGSITGDNGGPDPYKLTYAYTKAGNIQQATDGTTTRTYTYPPSGTTAVRPHAVTKISDGTHSDTYAYDDAGQMTSRTVAAKTTTLDWDALHKLTAATTGTSKTTFAYDADGNRIIRRDPGTTTLYLENMEVRSNGTATRYYTLGKATVALRKTGDAAATWLLADTQASAQLAIEGWTGKVARQRYLPFGAHRGGRDDITATERGFLGKTEDPTTALVATDNRYYDPSTGRFISPDPLGKPERPQSLNPYSYADNNPTTSSDPNGLTACDIGICPTPEQSRCAPALGGCTDTDNDGTPNSMGADGKTPGPNKNIREIGISGAIDVPTNIDINRFRKDFWKFYGRKWTGDTSPPNNDMQIYADVMSALLACRETLQCTRSKYYFKLLYAWVDLNGGAINFAEGGNTGRVRLPNKAKISSIVNRLKCNSFAPGTKVLMANGKTKPIDKIKVGDKVLATDPKTGKTKAKPVLATIVGTGTKHLVQITVHGSHPNAHRHHTTAPTSDIGKPDATGGVVIATDAHPFWVAGGINKWTKAAELKPGMWLRTSAGTFVQVSAVKAWSTLDQKVHNLATEDLHTYYVQAGATPILVHNSGPCEIDPIAKNIAKHANGEAIRLDGDGTHFVRGIHPNALGHYVDGVINQQVPNLKIRYLRNGRVGYWDPEKSAVVIEDGAGGTVFTPRGGYNWFKNVLQ